MDVICFSPSHDDYAAMRRSIAQDYDERAQDSVVRDELDHVKHFHRSEIPLGVPEEMDSRNLFRTIGISKEFIGKIGALKKDDG